MTTIQNQTFDQERTLYGVRDLLVRNCAFDGPADGESAFITKCWTLASANAGCVSAVLLPPESC